MSRKREIGACVNARWRVAQHEKTGHKPAEPGLCPFAAPNVFSKIFTPHISDDRRRRDTTIMPPSRMATLRGCFGPRNARVKHPG